MTLSAERYREALILNGRAFAAAILLVLWRRVPPVGLEVDDPAALDRFLTRLDLE